MPRGQVASHSMTLKRQPFEPNTTPQLWTEKLWRWIPHCNQINGKKKPTSWEPPVAIPISLLMEGDSCQTQCCGSPRCNCRPTKSPTISLPGTLPAFFASSGMNQRFFTIFPRKPALVPPYGIFSACWPWQSKSRVWISYCQLRVFSHGHPHPIRIQYMISCIKVARVIQAQSCDPGRQVLSNFKNGQNKGHLTHLRHTRGGLAWRDSIPHKTPVLSPDLCSSAKALTNSQSRHWCVELAPVNPYLVTRPSWPKTLSSA